MADIFLHSFVERIRGKLGQLVVKRVFGRDYIARPPTPTTRPATEAMLEVRKRFAKAGAYAKAVLGSPTLRAFYETKGAEKRMPSSAVAVGDFLRPPTVEEINLDQFRGLVGDQLTILAIDDVAVVSIDVRIRNAAGDTLEQGAASNANGPWVYAATTAMPLGQAITIEALAKDRPGNVGEGSVNFTRAA